MRLLVVNNLASGYRDGAVYDFLRLAAHDGDEIVVRNTDGTTIIESLLDDASAFDAVVASGGDGTIASVAHALAYTDIPILPFPAGTANLLANNLCTPYEPHAIAKLLKDMRTLDFDLGEIICGDKHFGFSVMAGAGYDATIMNDAKPAKRLLGPMAYFQAAVANPYTQKSTLTLDINGEHIEAVGLGVLLVNFSKIQFDITVTHGNEPRDGVFDVVVLKAQNAYGLIPALIAGLLDRDGEFPSRTEMLEIHRANSVTVNADPPMNIQYDGELAGVTTPFEAHVLKGAARFIISEEGMEQFSKA